MKLEFEDELIIEGVARAAERILLSGAFADRIADAIAQRFELLTPADAAAVLDNLTTRTLADNHVEWGLDKSVAFGPANPRYFLSQILERAKAKVIKGRKTAPANAVKMEGSNAA
jgi:hypothetical protein